MTTLMDALPLWQKAEADTRDLFDHVDLEYLSTLVTFRRIGAGHFRRNDATGNEQLEGSNGDQGCLILPPFASSVLGDSTPGFSPR
jgi:hypothetical protein